MKVAIAGTEVPVPRCFEGGLRVAGMLQQPALKYRFRDVLERGL